MKLIIFLDKDQDKSNEDKETLAKLSAGNLYYQLSKEDQDKISEEEESFLNGIIIETSTLTKTNKPIVFNYYKISHTPTIVFSNESEVIYHWEKIPNLSEIVKSMVSYFKILKLSELDYDYDPEE
jgi:hypothetical protein